MNTDLIFFFGFARDLVVRGHLGIELLPLGVQVHRRVLVHLFAALGSNGHCTCKDEHRTCKTVKDEHGTYKTVKARFWPEFQP